MSRIKLFISYCHADLTPFRPFKDSRVKRMIDDLERELSVGYTRSFFETLRDEEIITISENYRERIRTAIAQCDMAIIFLSSNYCISEECAAELEQLHEFAKPLYMVDTEPIWFTEDHNLVRKYQNALKDVLYVKFWEKDKNKIVYFGYPLPEVDPPTQKQYFNAIQDLAKGIKIRANALMMAENKRNEVPDQHHTMFLAAPTAETIVIVMQLAAAVKKAGHSVFTFDPELYVGNTDSFIDEMCKQLSYSDVYVQILGDTPGRHVPGTTLPLARAQYETATRTKIPTYVWQAPISNVQKPDSEHAAFLRSVASSCHSGSYPDFERYLLKKLNDLRGPRQSEDRRAERAQANLPLVAIDSVQDDRELAKKLSDALESYVNLGYLDYDLNADTFADAVVDNDGLILTYGTSAEGRKRTHARFKLIRRQKAEMTFRDIQIAIGDGAPPTALPRPRGPNIHVITVGGEVDTAAIFSFLKALGISVSPANEAH